MIYRIGKQLHHAVIDRREIVCLAALGPTGLQIANAVRAWRAHASIGNPLLKKVERQRSEWLAMNEEAPHFDEGDERVRIDVACRASKSARWSRLLFHLIEQAKPQTVLELGTNVGVSSAYMAVAATDTNTTVHTLDKSAVRMSLARDLHGALGLMNVRHHVGSFRERLPGVVNDLDSIGIAFIDGHHQLKPTLSYLDIIYPRLNEGAIVIFDDIAWSRGMRDAWQAIMSDMRFAFTVDLVKMGLAVARRTGSNDVEPVNIRLAAPWGK